METFSLVFAPKREDTGTRVSIRLSLSGVIHLHREEQWCEESSNSTEQIPLNSVCLAVNSGIISESGTPQFKMTSQTRAGTTLLFCGSMSYLFVCVPCWQFEGSRSDLLRTSCLGGKFGFWKIWWMCCVNMCQPESYLLGTLLGALSVSVKWHYI